MSQDFSTFSYLLNKDANADLKPLCELQENKNWMYFNIFNLILITLQKTQNYCYCSYFWSQNVLCRFKFFESAQKLDCIYAYRSQNVLCRSKFFEPAQNILGPVKGQGISRHFRMNMMHNRIDGSSTFLIINYLIFAHKEVGSNMGDINIAHI
jgi:hypothetical protein